MFILLSGKNRYKDIQFHRIISLQSVTFAVIMEMKVNDNELGIIRLLTHPRATRYTVKVVNGKVTGTMPPYGDWQTLLRLINENKTRLQQLVVQRALPLLDEQTQLRTRTFSLHIIRHSQPRFMMSLKEDQLNIACPPDTDFTDSETQHTLRRMLQAALRHEARRLLPSRLKELATLHGFTYKNLKIQSSKGRWGSCSSGGNINLSLNLMLLPAHLADYVMLHELCHTVEMNHGEHFWQLMDNVTNGQAKSLRKELTGFSKFITFVT
ncbi:M48 family metallopeptidase [Parabacteroides bouchesdurhonensis]|uniref:M48 family metallopeptidase n=1 Tax=Parabacteroides bouchesdurhonensis TaxID=1936995 RepID=UPI001F330DFF|nr:YgjP-like metallopeptidase domain-containing protein [Parabacteroides bouchesdurhonensis]